MLIFTQYGDPVTISTLLDAFGECEGCGFGIRGQDVPVRWGVLAFDDQFSFWLIEDTTFDVAFAIAIEASRRGGRFAGIEICGPSIGEGAQ